MIDLTLIIILALAAALAWHWYAHLPQYMPPMPTALRKDLWFGYYWDAAWPEIRDHVNMVFERGSPETAANMKLHGQPTILNLSGECFSSADFIPLPHAGQRVWQRLQELQTQGVLQQVKVLYPLDEPDMHGVSDADMTAMCSVIREEASKFTELTGVKLATIYTSKGSLPGFDAMDAVAMDDYGPGSNVLIGKPFTAMLARLRPDQGVFLVPGGGDPWRQDPEAFRRWAHTDARCVGILAFMWIERGDDPKNPHMPGVGTNGMADKYRAVGCELKGKA